MIAAVDPTSKGPRGGKMYRCAACGIAFPAAQVQVDHIDPIIPIGTAAKDMSWDTIIDRIFCSADNLQVLCKSDHKQKSAAEMRERRKHR